MPTSQQWNRRAVPGYMKIGRLLAITPMGADAPQRGDYALLDHAGRSRFWLTFDAKYVQHNGYLICYYFNPRGERGPESGALRFSII